DEVGQYIGDDSNLMLNLQTVREELSKECKGKAWVVVTSQQDVDSIMKVKGNDFSKIQGRFATRLALSSANVDEVIKKRILEKNDTGAQTLRLLYEQKATIIKNLIVFNDGVEKKIYTDEYDFALCYPFVPYQFNLLASVLTSIRTHGASGKHLSEGERSMLALFKESAVKIMDESEGAIVPFYRFYDALENFLDHSHRSVIIRAYDNSKINSEKKTSDVFAINVLKTLFMIKYILEIEANMDNITSLMISNIDEDRIVLKDKVEAALKTLQQQMLIQKNGSIYVFLTDEEQEINREINNQNVEMAEVINKVSEMIFEDIFSDKRYRYPAPAGNAVFHGRYTFPFNQTVDDRPYKSNQNYDIGLRILTPWYEGGNDDATLRMMSGTGREVLVLLPNDSAFLDELMTYLKIEKFLRLGTSTQLTKYETIKEAKRVEMRERNANAKLYLTEGLKEATIYVNGDAAHLSAKEVTGRINEAIGRLVQTVYHKLSYIDVAMDEVSVRKMFQPNNQMCLNLDEATEPNVHALDDVLNYIKGNTDIHIKTSMKTIKDRFMRAPYGFVEDDIYWLIARLFGRGDLTFTVNGAIVTRMNKSGDEIVDYITKKQYVDKLLMEVRIRVSEKDKKAVQKVIKELFGTSLVSEDEDTGMRNFQNYAQKRIFEMEKLESNYQQYTYPGKKVIDEGKKLLLAVVQISEPKEFYEYVSHHQDDFLDYAEDYEPVKSFFGGEQQQIFMRAFDMLAIYDDSKTYIVDAELERIVEQMRSIVKKDMPYRD
ncbi:MAG: BREX system P-loop protein BrxC, partial [Lachnospiraceae bacterium]|nr:BREX system P-loop protein BrxC [Lachnospiraceae bacterium]